jgi:hypothetical protein
MGTSKTIYVEYFYLLVNANSCVTFLGPLHAMASRKKKLGKYIEGRQAKYRHPYRILFHTSISPRKVLHPHITPYQFLGDLEREQPLLFLCPFNDIHTWVDWVFGKHRPRKREAFTRKVLAKKAYITLFVHLVRVNSNDLVAPHERFGQEFVVRKALRPIAVVPIRYFEGRTPNLAKVSRCMEKMKKKRIR